MKRVRAGAVVIHDGKLLVIHRRREGREYWTFPGGGVEAGERVQAAAAREVAEEASLEVQVEGLLYHHVYDDGTEQFFYRCRYLSGEPKLHPESPEVLHDLDSGELHEPIWLPLDRVPLTLLYPLEIRDWLLDDLATNFVVCPRHANLRIADLRESL